MAVVVSAVVAAIAVDATAAVILTAITEVGLASTVIGTLTGSKELKGLGMVMGVVGGVGGLANAAFGAATAATDVGASLAEQMGTDTGASFSDAGFAAANPASGLAEAANGAGGLSDAATAFSVPDPMAGITTQPLGVPGAQNPGALMPDPIQPMNVGDPTALPSGNPVAPIDPQAPAGTNGPAGNGNTYSDVHDPNYAAVNANSAGAGGDIWRDVSAKLGGAWEKLGATGKAEVIKAAMAIPGGIQAQKNKAAELALTQQKVTQSSYGSAVPSFGIINQAQGAR